MGCLVLELDRISNYQILPPSPHEKRYFHQFKARGRSKRSSSQTSMTDLDIFAVPGGRVGKDCWMLVRRTSTRPNELAFIWVPGLRWRRTFQSLAGQETNLAHKLESKNIPKPFLHHVNQRRIYCWRRQFHYGDRDMGRH